MHYTWLRLCCILIVSSGSATDVSLSSRIVGGYEADIKLHPYQVSLQYFNQHFCGGALITKDTVLTAAHCFGRNYSSISSFYDVKVGSNLSTSGQAYGIQSILIHPKYNSTTIDFDISLIKLLSNVTISKSVAPIRLSESDNYQWGSKAVVSGWGYQQENGSVSSLLRKVNVPLINRAQCEQLYDNIIDITKNMICAGYLEGGKDACQGDSGGPLVQNSQLIGVVSFGMGCARKSFPGVYTNVARLLNWVIANSNYNKNSTNNTDYFKSGQKSCSVVAVWLVIGSILIGIITSN